MTNAPTTPSRVMATHMALETTRRGGRLTRSAVPAYTSALRPARDLSLAP